MLFSLLINAFENASAELKNKFKAKKLAKSRAMTNVVEEDNPTDKPVSEVDEQTIETPEKPIKQSKRECLETSFKQFTELIDQEQRESQQIICGCIAPDNKLRKIIIKLTRSAVFEYFIILMIVLSCIQLIFIDPAEPAYTTEYSVLFSQTHFLPHSSVSLSHSSHSPFNFPLPFVQLLPGRILHITLIF